MSLLQRTLSRFASLPRVLTLVWVATRGWTVTWLALLIVQGLLPAALVMAMRSLVNGLGPLTAGEMTGAPVGGVVVRAAWVAGLLLLAEVAQSLMDWVRVVQAEYVQDHIRAVVQKKSTAVDLETLESAEYHERLYRAVNDGGGRSLVLLESGGGLIQNAITLTALAAVLIPYGLPLALLLVLSTLPTFYALLKGSLRYDQWLTNTTGDRRAADYYHLMLTAIPVAGELRLFGLGDHFRAHYRDRRTRLREERIALGRSQLLVRLLASSLVLLITAMTMGWVLQGTFQGKLRLGDLVLFYQAFSTGQGVVRAVLGNLGQLYSNSVYLEDLFRFFELQPRIADPAVPASLPAAPGYEVRVRGVTFRYPGRERPALRDLDLTIPEGKFIAILGANGAGKSSLLKLLCRLYEPETGEITLGGVNIRHLPLTELRQQMTVLFQTPVQFHASVRESIALGDLSAGSEAGAVEASAHAAGAHEFVQQLPCGYDTLLGRWWGDGVELSAGQWQRVALARALFRQAPVVILDEPTSFMDSWAEAEWFERMLTLTRGKTVIMITHRLHLAMRADQIYVLDEGRVVESGTHLDLVSQGGPYGQSWEQQLDTMSAEPHLPEQDEALASPLSGSCR